MTEKTSFLCSFDLHVISVAFCFLWHLFIIFLSHIARYAPSKANKIYSHKFKNQSDIINRTHLKLFDILLEFSIERVV